MPLDDLPKFNLATYAYTVAILSLLHVGQGRSSTLERSFNNIRGSARGCPVFSGIKYPMNRINLVSFKIYVLKS